MTSQLVFHASLICILLFGQAHASTKGKCKCKNLKRELKIIETKYVTSIDSLERKFIEIQDKISNFTQGLLIGITILLIFLNHRKTFHWAENSI